MNDQLAQAIRGARKGWVYELNNERKLEEEEGEEECSVRGE